MFFRSYGLENVARFSDPEKVVFRLFALGSLRPAQMLNLRTAVDGMRALLGGHRQGTAVGDPAISPGLFLIDEGRVVKAWPYRGPGDRPDYVAFAASSAPLDATVEGP